METVTFMSNTSQYNGRKLNSHITAVIPRPWKYLCSEWNNMTSIISRFISGWKVLPISDILLFRIITVLLWLNTFMPLLQKNKSLNQRCASVCDNNRKTNEQRLITLDFSCINFQKFILGSCIRKQKSNVSLQWNGQITDIITFILW